MATVGKDSKHLIQFWNSGKYTTVCRDNLSINMMIVRLLQELEEFYNLGRKTIIFTHMIFHMVFSFLQRKTHPERESFLTPCIGIRSSELIVMLYDSENKVLVESSCIPLFREGKTGCEFSYIAILVTWLTVNN